MSMLEFIFNVIGVVAALDLLICYYQLYCKENFLYICAALDKINQIKMLIEKVILVIYFAYLFYKCFIGG